MIITIARKEFRSLFATPSTWLILGMMQFIFAWLFLVRLDAFLQVQAQLAQIINAPGATLAIASPLFGALSMIMMMLVPVFTMRMIAEERRNHTMALLLAAPVSEASIVLGKFFGLMIFLLLIIAGSTLMVLSLALGTQLDTGLLLCNALGLLLLCSSYAALGLYVSSLTSQPVVAAVTAISLLFGLWLAEIAAEDGNNALRLVAPTAHFQNFNIGLLNSADTVYFVLFCAVFLLLAMRRLHNNRMYG